MIFGGKRSIIILPTPETHGIIFNVVCRKGGVHNFVGVALDGFPGGKKNSLEEIVGSTWERRLRIQE